MKEWIAALCCLMLAGSPLAMAQDKTKTTAPADKAAAKPAEAKKKEPSEAQKKQQELMKACNEKAADKKGDDRKKFMSTCLKGEDGPSAAQKAQQDKMTACNKQAGDKKLAGEERKKFMSTCLKG